MYFLGGTPEIIGRALIPMPGVKNAFFSYLCQLDNLVHQTALHPGKYFIFILQDRSYLPCIFGLLERSWGEVRSGEGHFLRTACWTFILGISSWVCKHLARPVRAVGALSPELHNWLLVTKRSFLALSMHFKFTSSSCLPPDTF